MAKRTRKNKNMNLIGNPKVSGSIFTAFVLFLIVLAGPAQAITLSLTGFGVSSVAAGGSVSTNASLKIDSQLDSDKVNLSISGPSPRTCIFSLMGQLILVLDVQA